MFSGKEYIYEVYKTRNITKAAQNLYISQPSLSATIKKIENRIGAPIFDRSCNPLQLTDCGKKYISYIERIFDMEKEFAFEINGMVQLQSGTLRIGGSNLFTSYILPPLISSFNARYPHVMVEMIENHTKALESFIADGTLDLAIDNNQLCSEVYANQVFCKEQLLLAVPAGFQENKRMKKHRMSACDIKAGKHIGTRFAPVSLQEFKDCPFLLLRGGNDTRSRSDLLFRREELVPKVVLELDQQATAYHVASYGMGIAFVTDTLIKNVAEEEKLYYYKLDGDCVQRDIYFYYKRSKYVTFAMREFLGMACEG